jgi:murein DD-endopeptidase MepM/ murein hydrolase activator NlpD
MRRERSFGGRIASLAAIVFLATWAGGATLYILFNDDALKYLAERQVSITRSYETQAAELQAEIERLRSLKLIDQERVDRAVADLARRQNSIETRQSAITALAGEKAKSSGAGSDVTGSAAANSRAPATRPASRPSPLSDTILIAPPAERWAQLHSRPLPALAPSPSARGAGTATDVHLTNLASGLRKLEAAQINALNEIETEIDTRARRLRRVLEELSVQPHRAARSTAMASAGSATGGPYLPWTRAPEEPFARQVHRIRATVTTLKNFEREIGVIPVRRPIDRDAEVTSGFGVRVDPFLRRPAMHTGVDFRGDTGDPVHATAAGRVVHAERDGGYGLMVEIDHGNGLATRYAHLSAIAVNAGATVSPGDVVGRIGSTGRSTGPHLHYEIRMLGDATDPQRFLRAGLRLDEAD